MRDPPCQILRLTQNPIVKNADFAGRRVASWDTHPAARPRPSILSKTPVDDPYLSNTAPHASQGRRIRRGLRPHAPTLAEHSRLNSPVGTKRVVAQTANVCTVRGLLCDGSASSVSCHFSLIFPIRSNFLIRSCVRVAGQLQNRASDPSGTLRETNSGPKMLSKALPGAPEMRLGALLGAPSHPIAGPNDPGNVSRARIPYFPFVKTPISPAAE